MEAESRLKPAVMAAINRQQSLLYLTLILGHEIFAWEGLEVRDLVDCGAVAEMSGMPPFICGGVFWNGEAVPVVDLQARTSRTPTPITRHTRVVVVEMVQGGQRQLLGIMMNPLGVIRGDMHPRHAEGPVAALPEDAGSVPRSRPPALASRTRRPASQACAA